MKAFTSILSDKEWKTNGSNVGRGTVYRLITHYPDHALKAASRVAVVRNDKNIADDTPPNVITSKMIETIYEVTL